MSYDLEIYCTREIDVPSVNRVLAEARAELLVEPDENLRAFSGVLPIRLQRGTGVLDEGPEWFAFEPESDGAFDDIKAPTAVRLVLARHSVRYSVAAKGGDEGYALAWLLAAASARAGEGVVGDPQEGEYYTGAAAWKQARRLVREIKPAKGKSDEERYRNRLRKKGWSDAEIEREIELWRPGHTQQVMMKEFEGLLGNPATLAAHMSGRLPLTDDELAFLLDRTWQNSNGESCRVFLATAAPDALARHLMTAARTVGLAARLYLEFLRGAGGLDRLSTGERQAIVGAASSAEMRDALLRGK